MKGPNAVRGSKSYGGRRGNRGTKPQNRPRQTKATGLRRADLYARDSLPASAQKTAKRRRERRKAQKALKAKAPTQSQQQPSEVNAELLASGA